MEFWLVGSLPFRVKRGTCDKIEKLSNRLHLFLFHKITQQKRIESNRSEVYAHGPHNLLMDAGITETPVESQNVYSRNRRALSKFNLLMPTP